MAMKEEVKQTNLNESVHQARAIARVTLKEYTKEQFIEVAIVLSKQYLLMKGVDREKQ
jgi:DNA replicative helicase MCM subunit Mcm2 (Cdc46/Mcm family)